MVAVKIEQRVSFPHKKGKAVGGGVSWKNCLKPSGSVFWKEDAHSIAYSKNEEESGCYKEKWKKCQWLLDTNFVAIVVDKCYTRSIVVYGRVIWWQSLRV